MNEFRVSNPDFIETVSKSFSKQGLMRHLGATMGVIEPGYVSITMPFSDDLTQQLDYYHAGSLTSNWRSCSCTWARCQTWKHCHRLSGRGCRHTGWSGKGVRHYAGNDAL